MNTLRKSIALGAGSLLVLAGASSTALAQPQGNEPGDSAVDQAVQQQESSAVSNVVQVEEVDGTFAYSQQAVDPISFIKKNLGDATQYLCGTRPAAHEGVAAEDWAIAVKGDVGHAFTATFSELVDSKEVKTLVMGCSCMGNPADGAASANAEVTGIPVTALLDMAQPGSEVNTIVFTSADGYEVALPLHYVTQRYCPLVFDVNGAPLAESVGGTNQLWLGSTAASYFARDVVSIELEARQTPPPNPNSDEAREAYENLPNIGVLYGGEVL